MKKRTYLKRMLAMGLALAMSLSLAACGNNEDNTESTPPEVRAARYPKSLMEASLSPSRSPLITPITRERPPMPISPSSSVRIPPWT